MHKNPTSASRLVGMYFDTSEAANSGSAKHVPKTDFSSFLIRPKIPVDYETCSIDKFNLEDMLKIYQTFRQRLIAPQKQTDKRLKLRYYYRIKLASHIKLREIFGRLTFFYPEDADIENVDELTLLVPQLKDKPVKVKLMGDWLMDKKNVESSRLRIPFFIAESEKDLIERVKGIQYNGFEPIFYGTSDPLSSPKNTTAWINVISGAWILSFKDEKRRAILEHFKTLMNSNSHMIINYRSPGNDIDLNHEYNIIPVQWAEHSFFDAFNEKHVSDLIVDGYERELQSKSISELEA
ncbi:MAG: hypothetical protein J0M11_06405 [Anaerolineae bacterium]|nr:hypothetical protein [Anaerolineae bacterium]